VFVVEFEELEEFIMVVLVIVVIVVIVVLKKHLSNRLTTTINSISCNNGGNIHCGGKWSVKTAFDEIICINLISDDVSSRKVIRQLVLNF
jgi:hypothetical protein